MSSLDLQSFSQFLFLRHPQSRISPTHPTPPPRYSQEYNAPTAPADHHAIHETLSTSTHSSCSSGDDSICRRTYSHQCRSHTCSPDSPTAAPVHCGTADSSHHMPPSRIVLSA